MDRYSVLVADDGFKLEDSRTAIRRAVRDAFQGLCIGRDVDVEFVSSLPEAIDRLTSSDSIHLAFLDVEWPLVTDDHQSNRNYKTGPMLTGLLKASMERPETTTTVISGIAGHIFRYQFEEHLPSSDGRRDKHPRAHAYTLKDKLTDSSFVSGVMEVAHDRSRLPLRSFDRDFRFFSPQGLLAAPSVDHVLIQELACAWQPRIESAAVTELSGGLSGAPVFFVRGDIGTGPAVEFVLKVAQRSQALDSELRAHESNAIQLAFAAGLFAAPLEARIRLFGGWSSLAFVAATGTTADSHSVDTTDPQVWTSVFPSSQLQKWVAKGRTFNVSFADWVTSDGTDNGSQGILAGDRVSRLRSEAAELGASPAQLNRLAPPFTGVFCGGARVVPWGVMHGDLHPRNVLVDENRSWWIDGASIRRQGLWLEDLARFSVFLLLSRLELSATGRTSTARQVLIALSVQRGTPSTHFSKSLKARIQETLAKLNELCEDHADTGLDWTDMVKAELLRAVYSRDWFSARTRLLALEAAVGAP